MRIHVPERDVSEFVIGDLARLSKPNELCGVVYALRSPGSKTIKYIGITKNPFSRHWHHVSKSHSLEVREWAHSLYLTGVTIEMVVFCAVIGDKQSLRATEYGYIAMNGKKNIPIRYSHNGISHCEFVSFDLLNKATNNAKLPENRNFLNCFLD
jgi:hypothetical protein